MSVRHRSVIRVLLLGLLACLASSLAAAPDEEKLGKSQGYPVGTARNYFYEESVRVGSFTHQGEIPGLFNGKSNVLEPASVPMPLPRAAQEPRFRWNVEHLGNLTVDDYLARQRIMGLMIIKDGVVQVERYQYDRTPAHRFVSHSMAKSITAIGIGLALSEGKIASLDDSAEKYAPKLAGTLYGQTSIRNLLRMASGAKFEERYDGQDDLARFGMANAKSGIEAAAHIVTERATPTGTKFNYASPETAILGAVLRGATGMSVSDYLTPRLWQAMGAETSALWRAERTGLEVTGGNLNATLRDYARLGILLANDGVRPDDPQKKQIVPLDFLLEATDWKRVPEAFRPRNATPYYGYGYQFWLFPGDKRRFALLGVYGQLIFVDPALKLVMVQTAANATARAGQTSLGREMDAFWRGVVRYYGYW
jgi:CubicO group peptidase (beta-lactamase class C family)